MKLRIPARRLPDHTNSNGPPTGHALHCRYLPSLLLGGQHMPKRPVRLAYPQPTRQRRLLLLYLHLPAHRTGPLLRLLPPQRNLKHRSNSPANPHSNSLRRLRPAMRTDIILRGHRNHQPILSPPIHRANPSRMGLRGILSRQPNPNPILRHPLPTPLPNCRDYPSPLDFPARIRLKQPPRHCIRLR